MSEGAPQLSEFELIAQIRQSVSSDALVGIGDDAAVLDMGGAQLLLATVDMQIEDVHFRRSLDPMILGQRLIAVNVSDVAAMGGRPLYALVSLALPPDLPTEYVLRLYEGLTAAGKEYGIGIVGGNISRTAGPLAADLTLLGSVASGDVVRRSGALPGDVIAVSETLGNAALIRFAFERGWQPANDAEVAWYERYRVPRPPVNAARALAEAGIPHAMMDISDGVAGDLPHLCASSGVGASIRASALPIHRVARMVAGQLGLSIEELALGGGEDYQLLIALPEARIVEAQRLALPLQLTPIGAITEAEGGILLEGPAGIEGPITESGWTHF